MFHPNLWPPPSPRGFSRPAIESMTSESSPGDDVIASRPFLSSAITLSADDNADLSAKTRSSFQQQQPQSENGLPYGLFQFSPRTTPRGPYPMLGVESLLPSCLYPRVASLHPSSLETLGLHRHALLGGAFAVPHPSAFRPAGRRPSRPAKTDKRSNPGRSDQEPMTFYPAVHRVDRCRAKGGAPVRLRSSVGQSSSPTDAGAEERGQPGFGSEGSRTCETETGGEEGSSKHKGQI